MKATLVIDWLDKYAGSERVIKAINETIDFTYYYSLINMMSPEDLKRTFGTSDIKIHTSSLQYTGKYFRYLLPLFPLFTKQLVIPKDSKLIISSSHAVAKSISSEHALHISYFQARNFKYIWDEQDLYFKGIKKVFKVFIPYLQKFDFQTAQKPDYIIANSSFVQNWIMQTYGRESIVIHPPVDVDTYVFSDQKEEYFVTVGRLEPYKRFDIIIDAFNKNGKKLIVIGDGSQKKMLMSKSKENIVFTGYLQAEGINKYLSKAKAFVYAGLEDFGIAPVEAQACGTPVIAYGKGGILDTVIHKKTGIYFHEQTLESVNEAIDIFEKYTFDHHFIADHASRFSTNVFKEKFQTYVEKCIQNI